MLRALIVYGLEALLFALLAIQELRPLPVPIRSLRFQLPTTSIRERTDHDFCATVRDKPDVNPCRKRGPPRHVYTY